MNIIYDIASILIITDHRNIHVKVFFLFFFVIKQVLPFKSETAFSLDKSLMLLAFTTTNSAS